MSKRELVLSGLSLFLIVAWLNSGAGVAGAARVEQKQVTASKKGAYRCFFTNDPINVDGILDEPVWEKAEVLNFIIPETLKKPISKTEGRILYDKDYLYVSFKAYDQDVWSLFTERDSGTCLEDVLEIFFKTDPDKDPYYDFEINALGTIFDAFIVKRGSAGNFKRWSAWNCKGLKIAILTEGTLNNWQDKDEYWTLEAAIPFADLSTLSGKSPQSGDTWLFHLARYDYSVYLPKGVELSSCARLSKVDFHLYEDWLRLIFEQECTQE